MTHLLLENDRPKCGGSNVRLAHAHEELDPNSGRGSPLQKKFLESQCDPVYLDLRDDRVDVDVMVLCQSENPNPAL